MNGLTSTTFNQFPYQCLIFVTRPTVTVQCGASLISGNSSLIKNIDKPFLFLILIQPTSID